MSRLEELRQAGELAMPEANRCPKCGGSVYPDAMTDGLCPACLFTLGLAASHGEESPDEPELPHQIGHFEIIDVLGRGGMGVVYRARDPELGREVAIKILPAEFGEDPARLARFRREAKLLASLNHPNIATIHSIGEWCGLPYFVLELVAGESLAERLETGPLTTPEGFDIYAQVARALAAAHAEGIVHRDLKPANVMVTPTGLAKILDFGIARSPGHEGSGSSSLTATGTLMGTVPYMSPEQIRGGEVDERSDVWAFGCMLYEMLTGRSPFERETAADTLSAILEQDPDLETLPRSAATGVRNLLSGCLRKDPAERTRDIGALAQTLDHAGADVGGRASAWPALTRTVAAVGWLIGATGALLAAVATLGTLSPSTARGLLARAPEIVAIIPDGGQIVVVALFVGTAGIVMWQLGRAVGAQIFNRILHGSIGLAVALVCFFLLAVSATTGRFLTAAVVALLGATAWVAIRERALARGPMWLLAAFLTFFFGVTYSAEGWWFERAERIRNDAVSVYVVLPFQRFNDENHQELLETSEHFRSTLEAVFGGLDSVRVLPSSFTVEPLSGLPPQCTAERLGLWTADSSLAPDFVLCGTMDLFDQEGAGRGIKLVFELNRVEDGTLRLAANRLDETAAYDDIKYVAILTTFELLDILTAQAGTPITPGENATILGRIAGEYEEFLAFRESLADDAIALLVEARLADSLDRASVADALSAYASPVDAESYAARQAQLRNAVLQKLMREQ